MQAVDFPDPETPRMITCKFYMYGIFTELHFFKLCCKPRYCKFSHISFSAVSTFAI